VEDLSLLFAYLAESNANLATRIFSALPAALQNEISQNLVKLSMADPERLSMLESRIKTAVEFGLRGSDRLGRILSRLPPGEREGILGDLMSKNPEGAEGVEKSLLLFEKIIEFKPEELRRLIVTVPYEDWGVALRGASPELSERMLAELPAGTRNLVQEASQAPQQRDKIMECRSRILTQVQALAARGLIDLKKQGVSSEMI
jgi:flagellar motor switch protein FliG